MNRRDFLRTSAAGLSPVLLGLHSGSAAPAAAADMPEPDSSASPNIIFFTWHDAGDWFGCYGHKTVHTPGVDRLAREGVRFANNYSACAICSPSRAAMMTGRHCQATGVMRLTNTVFDARIDPRLEHLARRVKRRGYRTALLGVQHEAAHEHVEEIMGFDERIATDPWPNSDILAVHARRWLAARAGEKGPFYLQVGSYDSHLNRFYSNRPPRADEPYAPVEDVSLGMEIPPYLEDNDAGRRTVATLQGLLRRGDRLMQSILSTLDETGQAENTLVVMCVDHGVGLPRAKTTCYDAGLKTGWLMRWPGHLPAGRVVDTLSTHVDVLPTLAELLGWGTIPGLDGMSHAARATGAGAGVRRTETYAHMIETVRSIRTERYKLIRNFRPSFNHAYKGDCGSLLKGETVPDRPAPAADQRPDEIFPATELYDLKKDPNETRNLSVNSEYADVHRELDDRLWRFLAEQNDFLVHEPVRSEWQRATRLEFERFCERDGRRPPLAEGPFGNAVDHAAAAGQASGAGDV